ncbi:MAG: PAS domain-containing protein [Deltaproteobacteria bacterium]|nr:PAS domain-containing protein [Deltaproteobacteria bacterium]
MRLSLSARVFAGFLAVLALFGLTVGFGLLRMHAIRENLRYTADTYVALTRNLAQVKTLLDIRDDYTERALSEANPQVRTYLVRYARDFYPLAIRTRMTEARNGLQRALAGPVTDTEQRFLADGLERLRRMEEGEAATEEALLELFDRADMAEADRAVAKEKARDRASGLVKEARLLSLNVDERVVQAVLQAERDELSAAWGFITLSLVALLLGSLVTWWVARGVRPLRQLGESAHALARGTYDVEFPSDTVEEVAALSGELRALAQALREREGALARGNEELTRLKAFLESVLASARAGIVVADGALKVRRLNPAARSAMQLGILEVEGRPLEDLPAWPLLRPHEAALKRAAQGGDGVHLTGVALARPDGTEMQLDVDVEPLRDPRSATPVSGVVVLLTDVTERERARERLTATERLAAVGHLAAQVAHEIRNPLSSIGLNCALLEDELADVAGERAPEVGNLLRAIGREIDRLAELTEGYLRHARPSRGLSQAVPLNDVVEDLANLVRDDLRRRGITLVSVLSPDAGQVRADAGGLRQVLLNLVRNAGEAVAGRPGGTVRLATARGDDGRVLLTVDDNGPGVPADLRERIFEPFFTTKDAGSGLGLSGSRAALKEHSAELHCTEGTLGGARFVVTLLGASPRDAAAAPPAVADA